MRDKEQVLAGCDALFQMENITTMNNINRLYVLCAVAAGRWQITMINTSGMMDETS